MSNELQTEVNMGMLQAHNPKALVAGATEMATELANVINSRGLFNLIGDKKFVRVEGWTTLSAMLGCVPQEVSNEKGEDGRYIAVVELKRMSDQQVISRASAECGAEGEPRWGDADEYAKRSMAATRATSKACRLAFSWIMVLAGYEPTPAEEIDGKARQNVERNSSGGDICNFGKKFAGKPWSAVPTEYCTWITEKSNAPDAVKARAKKEIESREMNQDPDHTGTQPASNGDPAMMANEVQIRDIHRSLEKAGISMEAFLDRFKFNSTDEIPMAEVNGLKKWIADQANGK